MTDPTMRPEDVPEEWVALAGNGYAQGSGESTWDVLGMRVAIAAVAPLIAKREREACAKVVDDAASEVQDNIRENIAEVRHIQIGPADNRPLIVARDWLKHVAAAIRARATP